MSTIMDSGLRTQDSGLRTQDSGLRTQDSGRIVRFSPFSDDNPYISLMHEAIVLGGYSLNKKSLKKALLHCDVFHFNWDIFIFGGSRRRRLWNLLKKIVCVFCIKALGRKMVYTLHDKLPLNSIAHRSRASDFMAKFMLKYADKIIIHSTESISAAKAILPEVDKTKFVYVPHPNYITAYQDTKTFNSEIRGKHRIILLFAGRIQRYKCIDVLVRAAKELQSYRDIHFLICGRADKDYVAELSELM